MMIPRNRVRYRGIKTQIELEPKEYQIMILPHCQFFSSDHSKNLIPPRSVFISQKMRFRVLQRRIIDIMNND